MFVGKQKGEKKSHGYIPVGINSMRMLIILCMLCNLCPQMAPDVIIFMAAVPQLNLKKKKISLYIPLMRHQCDQMILHL